MVSNFTYIRPRTLKQAVQQLESEGARLHAGGTDLLGCLRDGVFDATKLVSLSGLGELRGIQDWRGGLRIGALTTVAEVAAHPLVGERYPGLAQAAAAVASPQLRNQGTLGGNLCQRPRCWYFRGEFACLRKGGDICFALEGQNQYHGIFGADRCCIVHPSDTAPALTALQAKAVITGPGGRREVPVEAFFVGPAVDVTRETVLELGEVLTEILLPAPARGLRSSYRKVRARQAWDFALAGVALALRFDGPRVAEARVVLSGAAPVPWRSRLVEQAITGSTLDEATLDRAAVAVVQGADPLEHNGYKLPLFAGLIREELAAIRG
jgi:xanthine dehydrogenase YagS FAD-binding subunit